MSKPNSSVEKLPIRAVGTATVGVTQRGPRDAPPRVQSTVPPSSDTDPLEGQDEDDDGELTEGREETRVATATTSRTSIARTTPTVRDSTEDDDESDLWIEDDNDDNSRLESELHPNYVSNPGRRNHQFQEKFGELVRLVSHTLVAFRYFVCLILT